jgi:hypothetical protein
MPSQQKNQYLKLLVLKREKGVCISLKLDMLSNNMSIVSFLFMTLSMV